MKKVLVTGARGFIGRQCLSLLKEKGYEVHALTSSSGFVTEDIFWKECNLLTHQDFNSLLEELQPTHLLHLAWTTEPGKYWKSSENLAWVRASLSLVQAFVNCGGKRAVFAGTCAEYNWMASEFKENSTSCNPHTLYGTSKLSLCKILNAFANEVGLSQAWGRIFYLYGPYESPQRLVSSLILGLLQKRLVPCSQGTQIRDFLHVQDVANAFVSLLDSDLQGVVNIGSGRGLPLKEIIGMVAEHLKGSHLIQLGAIPMSASEPPSLIADVGRLRNELRWTPKWDLKEGLEDTIHWWKKEICQ